MYVTAAAWPCAEFAESVTLIAPEKKFIFFLEEIKKMIYLLFDL